MVVSDLLKKMEKRHMNLKLLLKHQSAELGAPAVHKIRGAIKETDWIIQVLKYFRTKEIMHEKTRTTFQFKEKVGAIRMVSGKYHELKRKFYRTKLRLIAEKITKILTLPPEKKLKKAKRIVKELERLRIKETDADLYDLKHKLLNIIQ